MKPPVIVDTSALFSLVSQADQNHGKAAALSRALGDEGRTQLLPADVFTELINILGKKLGRAFQLYAAADLLHAADLLIIETDQGTREDSLKKLKTQADSVSYTDCLVMAVADRFETMEIFGFDAVFAKNGYRLPDEGRAAA